MKQSSVKQWLAQSSPLVFVLIASLSAFSAYSCMYAFRKAFVVAMFDGMSFWGINYKILLITSQVLGYMLSKFIGIKVISEMSGKRRAAAILLLIGMAQLSLVFFAFVPPPWNIVFLFFNGLPLGLIWGLVFSYLEGRQTTELLGAALSASFIFASGFVQSVGKFVILQWGVSEFAMPCITGFIFTLPLLLSVWLLEQIPPPSAQDIQQRTRREPMKGKERLRFVREFRPGLFLLIFAYFFLTAVRDLRDNFAAELWQALGYGNSPEVFTLSVMPVTIGVLLMISLMVLVRNNLKALVLNHWMIFSGFILSGASTLAFQYHWISPLPWMILVGLGLYMAYVPYNSILFDRLIATFKYVSNVGFLIYLADSFGYLGSVAVMFYKNFGQAKLSWLQFFIGANYLLSIIGGVSILFSLFYFHLKYKQNKLEVKAL